MTPSNSRLDLWTISPEQVREMISHYEEDSATRGALEELERAILAGDVAGRVEAISNLTEELVIKQGHWF